MSSAHGTDQAITYLELRGTMETLWQDLHYGWRMLRRNPGFTLVAILTLAAGIGLNSAVFSMVNSIILRPLPYKEPERLVQVWESTPPDAEDDNVISPGNFLEWQTQAKSFESLSVYNGWLPAFSEMDKTTQIVGAQVSINFFEALGITPQFGRTFVPGDEKAGRDHVVIVSHSF